MQTNTLTSALAAIATQFEQFGEKSAGLNVFTEKGRKLRALIARHQASLERLEKRRTKASEKVHKDNPHANARYLHPLADAVLVHFPGMAARIMGPYGLGNTASISIYDPAKGETDDSVVGWLQFRCDADVGQVLYVDLDQNTGCYPPGSIGELNGLNHPGVAITDDTPMERLIELFRRGAPRA